ncbi:MAG TPA: hypothetical protein VJ999_05515 [Candidatus Sulfotelmatobacter sp.]|nr:hypothetical protein [Candidatus Sulfotelmatobacter sp.]
MVLKNADAGKKARQHDVPSAGVARAGEHQVVGHDAQAGAQVEHIPALFPENRHRRSLTNHRIAFARNGLDERGLAAAVGAEDGDVLIGADAQGEIVQSDLLAAHDAQVLEVEQRRCESHVRRIPIPCIQV